MKPSRTAIVTGASTGIGRGIALKLAAGGCDLFISHLNEPEQAEEVAREIDRIHSRRCVVFQGDLCLAETAEQLVERALEHFTVIDVLVNNAGITRMGKMTEFTRETIDQLYQLNYRAPMLLTGLVANHMIRKQVKGSILYTTSSRGTRAYPADAIYGGLKGALDRSVQSIALELAPYGIRVNAIAPGAIRVRPATGHHEKLGSRIPLGRMGLPSDIGSAAAFLCSDEASYITGITLRVDGGLILPGMPESLNVDPDNIWGKIN
ncbi:SDR family NAD(P)-dependent oxidoreductase [Paenibacillus piri]|uniref:SDR family oxidoreductase n=1 Tax=Paenibacillus piri TaxID=2547395 RepID=A0A4R5KSJ2_9BACL|nr:SDR family oxidoreductase [Paenibacillus piri]TDF98839.1 SDR family oxidoreductase [Paenibacillus piri]